MGGGVDGVWGGKQQSLLGTVRVQGFGNGACTWAPLPVLGPQLSSVVV